MRSRARRSIGSIPYKDDFYKRVIELRRRVKADLKEAERRDPNSQEIKNLDMNQLALKILANATSYGIFIELNVEDTDDEDAPVSIFTSQGKRIVETRNAKRQVDIIIRLLATLITGAARLMLALTERLAFEHGLNWAFCDTDSMAFANTENLPFDEFVGRVRDVCDWFVPLNPYEPDPKKGAVSILEMEDQNFSKEKGKKKKLEPLYCFAISAKRYALFNRDATESQSSARPPPMALATSPLPMATRRKAATSEAAASGCGKRTFGSRSFPRPSATSPARSTTHSGAKC